MGSSLPFKFAFLFSLSLAGAASFTTANAAVPYPIVRNAISKSSHSISPPPRPKATASDLLSILGSSEQARSVNAQVARDLQSCFKFLAPYNQTPNPIALPSRRRIRGEEEEIDNLIATPPPSVLELARLAVDSGADPAAIHRALDPTIIPVPDVEGCNEHRCQLTRTPYGRRFIDEGLNSYIEFLFEIIVERGPKVDLNVSLSRYDFFHGHLFVAKESGRVGILFHAKEYPAYEEEEFPYNMGYCQVGSNVDYEEEAMNLRNILWLAPMADNTTKSAWLAPGVLVVLDANRKGIIYRDLIPEYAQYVRTLYEDDFGEVVVDVNYLDVGGAPNEPKFQLFIC